MCVHQKGSPCPLKGLRTRKGLIGRWRLCPRQLFQRQEARDFSRERLHVNHVVINKDGSMVCHAPVSYIHVSPKRKVSEKQKLAAKERFQKMWAEKKGISDEQEEELLDEILDSLDDEQVEEDD